MTGLVSLGAEVSFTRTCERLLGQTNATVAAVLTAWLLGLFLGACLGGASERVEAAPRRSARRALAAVGALVLLTSLALPLLVHVPVGEDDGFAWARAVAVVVMLLPTSCAAGFAFPALVRAWGGAGRAGGAGSVYAAETLGAVVGALAAGFLLPRFFGHLGGAAALGAIALIAGLAPSRAESAGAAAPDEGSDAERLPGRHLLAVALAGGAALALELLWTRVLLFFVPGLTGALAAVLAGILLGSSVGATIGAARARRGDGRRAAAVALIVGAAGVGVGLAVLPVLADAVRAWPHPVGGGFHAGHEMIVSFLVAAAVSFLPTAASGAAFALLARASNGAATAYGASCLGSVVGVVVAAGLGGAVVPVRAGIAVCGVVLAIASVVLWRRGDGAIRLAPAIVVAAAVLLVPRDASLLAQSVEFRKSYAAGRTVLAVDEDRHVVASVVDLGDGGGRALYTNAFLAASTQPGYGYMRMLGHLPALVAGSPERALVIAYGTGTTVGSLALHPEVRAIDIAEISPAVMRLAPWFERVNRGVPYSDTHGKEIRVRVGDGRAIVERDGRPYDVVTLEPLPPETPAAVHFYTREFYQACLRRLSPGGALCQWIPLHTSDPRSFRVLLRTFAETMPTTWLFLFDQCALLVGRPEAGATIAVGALQRRASVIAEDLRRAGMEDVAAVLGAYVADRGAILAATTDVAVMTDDYPEVALRLARPARESLDDLAANARLLAELEGDVMFVLGVAGVGSAELGEFVDDVAASARAKRSLREWRALARVDPERATSLLREAIAARPTDLEARRLLGHPPSLENTPPRLDDAAVRRILIGEGPAGDLAEAIEIAGVRVGLEPRLLLPFLDHESLDVRLKAMVALRRRVGDVGGYDPMATGEGRRRAIEELEGRIQ